MAEDPKIAALDDLIGQGVKSAFVDGDRVEFQSTGELIKASNHLARKGRKGRLKPIILRMPRSY